MADKIVVNPEVLEECVAGIQKCDFSDGLSLAGTGRQSCGLVSTEKMRFGMGLTEMITRLGMMKDRIGDFTQKAKETYVETDEGIADSISGK